jgi:catechol 2,3-dioxygenase-like lactoylglutathione lyase family enzyme
MIHGVNQVVLHVEDQEAAKRFWVDTLGFTLAEDTPVRRETLTLGAQPGRRDRSWS